MFYLTTHSTHFIYGYMASDIWLRTILIVRKEIRCRRHIGYSYRLTALAGTRNSSMGPPNEGSQWHEDEDLNKRQNNTVQVLCCTVY